ncbi:histone deacetylase [Nakamurella sp. A5-74]|uniref:Histone deacetylase n=1 Tax=Nakamurella sp. A5-74 TaxID=3158264 RepID=A0AAU8DLI9_9ACTN
MEPSALVWYVSYGSNLSRARFLAYLQGGRIAGSAREYAGAFDRTEPLDDAAVELPGRIYFAGESKTWGGGMAFYDHDEHGPTPARAYLITAAQFADVAAQEMHRLPDPADPLQRIVIDEFEGGRHTAGPGRYETLIEVGVRDGVRMLTFTSPHGAGAVSHTAPSATYRALIAAGLAESHHWDPARIDSYFFRITSPVTGPSHDQRGID